MLAFGCYAAPDYSGAHFKCDGEHPCPDGQQCVNSVCSGGGSNMVDAATSGNGVACGTATCGASQKCCADFVSGPICIALSASCTGFAATCDGKEDCPGATCCETGTITIGCISTCPGSVICRESTDCPAVAPICCPSIGTMEPWGRCNVGCP